MLRNLRSCASPQKAEPEQQLQPRRHRPRLLHSKRAQVLTRWLTRRCSAEKRSAFYPKLILRSTKGTAWCAEPPHIKLRLLIEALQSLSAILLKAISLVIEEV